MITSPTCTSLACSFVLPVCVRLLAQCAANSSLMMTLGSVYLSSVTERSKLQLLTCATQRKEEIMDGTLSDTHCMFSHSGQTYLFLHLSFCSRSSLHFLFLNWIHTYSKHVGLCDKRHVLPGWSSFPSLHASLPSSLCDWAYGASPSADCSTRGDGRKCVVSYERAICQAPTNCNFLPPNLSLSTFLSSALLWIQREEQSHL